MKIVFTLLLIALFLSCKKNITGGYLNFIHGEGIKIKEITNFKENYVSRGCYKIKKDTVISNFEIQSKYSLMVIKLKNVSHKYELNYYSNSNSITPGIFSSVFTSVQYVDFSTSIFENNYKINNISLISDKEISCHINNDSIKSFSMKLNEYVIKINNDINKVISGQLEYYDLKYITSNILFYKIKDDIYIFIMTPLKKSVVIEDSTLYNLLFPKL